MSALGPYRTKGTPTAPRARRSPRADRQGGILLALFAVLCAVAPARAVLSAEPMDVPTSFACVLAILATCLLARQLLGRGGPRTRTRVTTTGRNRQ